MGTYLKILEFLYAISIQDTCPANTEDPTSNGISHGATRPRPIYTEYSQQWFPRPTQLEGKKQLLVLALWWLQLIRHASSSWWMVYLLLDIFWGIYFLNREISKKKMTINTIIYCTLHLCQDCGLVLPTILWVEFLNQSHTHAVISRARVQSDLFIIKSTILVIRLEMADLPPIKKEKK